MSEIESSSAKKPERVAIPDSFADDVLVKSKHSCCICETYGVQLNHIDEDPSNNDPDNLAPLCPNCHAKYHSTSGLTRGITPRQLKMYRDNWFKKCASVDVQKVSENQALTNIEQRLKDVEERLKPNE